MAIALTDTDLNEMRAQFGQRISQPAEFGEQFQVLDCLGSGQVKILALRNSMGIQVNNLCYRQPFRLTRQHESEFSLVAKFFLSGESRVQTLDAPDISSDYREVAGCNYLYHLPDLTEVEAYPADERIHLIYITVDPAFFQSFRPGGVRLAAPLQRLLEGDRTQRFHQPLGHTTPVMRELLKQILHCPYQGLMQQLYLESKALELLAAQFSLWTDAPPSAPAIALSAQDVEQLHQAKAILMQQATDPPSLIDLARQVGLNDRKLKSGFRQVFGTTTFGYLRAYRLQQARELLQNSDMSIASVAATVGYNSQGAFCHAFRRQFAITPKAYQLSQRS
ncbi:MAG: AraC family transcriptional regulator [Cyanobacteria bacterium P01_A01_bin.17]